MPCVLFGHRSVEITLQKTISDMSNSSNPLFVYKLLSFFERKDENWVNWKNWVWRGTNFLKNHQAKKGGEKINKKFVWMMGCFVLIYSLVVIMLSDTAFKKSSLEILSSKVVVISYRLASFLLKFRLICVCKYLD